MLVLRSASTEASGGAYSGDSVTNPVSLDGVSFRFTKLRELPIQQREWLLQQFQAPAKALGSSLLPVDAQRRLNHARLEIDFAAGVQHLLVQIGVSSMHGRQCGSSLIVAASNTVSTALMLLGKDLQTNDHQARQLQRVVDLRHQFDHAFHLEIDDVMSATSGLVAMICAYNQ